MTLYKALREASGPTSPLVWLPELILRQGKDPDVICRSVGLDESFRNDPLKPFPLSDYFEVLNGLMRHLHLPDLGVLLAERVRITDLYRIAPIVDTSETLGEALWKVCEASTRTILPGCRVALTTYGDRCLMHVEMPPGSAEVRRPFMELLILIYCSVVRRVLGPAWNPQRLLLRHKNASSLAALQRNLRESTIQFGQRRDGFEFPAVLLNAPVPSRSIDLDMLHHVVRRELACGRAHIDQTARLFGLSRRSLQRRLSEQGITYRRLILDMRMALAIEYLSSSQGLITTIARHLGYNHHADFTRNFKSRYGVTPNEYRRKL